MLILSSYLFDRIYRINRIAQYRDTNQPLGVSPRFRIITPMSLGSAGASPAPAPYTFCRSRYDEYLAAELVPSILFIMLILSSYLFDRIYRINRIAQYRDTNQPLGVSPRFQTSLRRPSARREPRPPER